MCNPANILPVGESITGHDLIEPNYSLIQEFVKELGYEFAAELHAITILPDTVTVTFTRFGDTEPYTQIHRIRKD